MQNKQIFDVNILYSKLIPVLLCDIQYSNKLGLKA